MRRAVERVATARRRRSGNPCAGRRPPPAPTAFRTASAPCIAASPHHFARSGFASICDAYADALRDRSSVDARAARATRTPARRARRPNERIALVALRRTERIRRRRADRDQPLRARRRVAATGSNAGLRWYGGRRSRRSSSRRQARREIVGKRERIVRHRRSAPTDELRDDRVRERHAAARRRRSSSSGIVRVRRRRAGLDHRLGGRTIANLERHLERVRDRAGHSR